MPLTDEECGGCQRRRSRELMGLRLYDSDVGVLAVDSEGFGIQKSRK